MGWLVLHRKPWYAAVLILAVVPPSGGAAGSPQATAQTGLGTIVGRVVDAGTRQGVANAEVAVSANLGRSRLSTVIATERGDFVLSGLPPGKIMLWASKAGYIGGYYGQQFPSLFDAQPTWLELGPGARVLDAELRLWKTAAVSGRLARGTAPVVDAEVVALRKSLAAGHGLWQRAASGRTDDRGLYRVSGLMPGHYVIAARFGDSRSVVFYPDSPTPSAVRDFDLESGDDIDGIDLQDPAASPPVGVSVHGQVAGAGRASRIEIFDDNPDGPIIELPLASAETTLDGLFVFQNVPAGRYRLRVQGATPTASPVEAAIEVAGREVDDVRLSAALGGVLSGGVTFDVTVPPASGAQASVASAVWAIRADGRDTTASVPAPVKCGVKTDGRFSTPPLPLGKYALTAARRRRGGASRP